MSATELAAALEPALQLGQLLPADPPDVVRRVDPGELFRLVDVAGVVANGFLGGTVARRMGYDIVGFVVLGMASGLGGGALRDMLIGAGPVVMLTDPAYLTGAIVAATVAYVVDLRGRWATRLLTVLDLLAVGCWAATGAAKALGFGLGWVPAVLLGTMTAVGGGLVRDVLVGRVPTIFGGNPLYASLAALGSVEMTAMTVLGHPQLGMAVSILSCAALGLLARRRRWTLPGATDLAEYRPRPLRPPLRRRASGRRTPQSGPRRPGWPASSRGSGGTRRYGPRAR